MKTDYTEKEAIKKAAEIWNYNPQMTLGELQEISEVLFDGDEYEIREALAGTTWEDAQGAPEHLYNALKIAEENSDFDLTIDNVFEIARYLEEDIRDFEVDDFRFIHQDDIDQIQQEELSSDEYVLGCFKSWFLADVLDIDLEVIESMQEAEAFEAIGKLVISMDKLGQLQEGYTYADGYGHHFSRYDGSEWEACGYYIFRLN